MKANLKSGIWVMAAMVISLSTIAQGRSGRDRDRDRWEDDDWYEDRYRHDRYDDRRSSQYKIVRHRPPAPHYKVPRRPSHKHVWIPGEYRWHRGGYVFAPGYWMVPPRRNMQYVPGYWQPTRGGYVWVSGFWQGVNVNIGWRN